MALRGAAPPTLLILRALGLGDLLTGVPALRALARAFPGHHRVLAAPRALADLAALSGAVDAVLDTPGLGAPPPLAGADVAVNLHGRGPLSHRRLLATGPTRLLAFRGPGAADGPTWRPREHEVARWSRLVARTTGEPARPGDLRLARPAAPAGLAGGPDTVVVHPGAAAEARRWPAERFALVAGALAAQGLGVLVTGDRRERSLAAAVAARAGLPGDRVVAGRTSLLELAGLVARARLVVCGDTGVAHLATAFATPSVVLFGPVPPSEWGPPADGPHRALWAGRRGDPHAVRPDAGLLALDPALVLDAAAELLATPLRPGRARSPAGPVAAPGSSAGRAG